MQKNQGIKKLPIKRRLIYIELEIGIVIAPSNDEKHWTIHMQNLEWPDYASVKKKKALKEPQ